MLSKNEIRTLEKKFGFRPQKSLGQNFLIDGNVQKKIIDAACLRKSDIVLEIGPGLGELTLDISKAVRRVIAVEFDKKLFAILNNFCGDFKNITLIHEDFLKCDVSSLLPPGERLKVVSNLPYYVSTPIILKLLGSKSFIESAVLTLQKEVAERLTAGPGGKEYGSLSLFTVFQAEIKKLFSIKKNSFYPVPLVDSAVILLRPREKPPVEVIDEANLLALIKAAFSARRKTIANSLLTSKFRNITKKDIYKILRKVNIPENVRAENLSLDDFARIADSILT